jgi:transposase
MPCRVPLQELPVNRLPNQELSDGIKERLYGCALAGQGNTEIAEAEQLSINTVIHSIQRTRTRHTVVNEPRSGRPRKYSERDARSVIRFSRLHPKSTYNDLRRNTGLNLSTPTLRGILQDVGIINWRTKRRPHLTQGHAAKRLQFTRQWLDHDWLNTIFSDECSVEKGVGKERRWAFGYPAQKWDHDKIEEYPKGK